MGVRYYIHEVRRSLTLKCHMLINILIMSPDTHSYSDLDRLSKEPHHAHYTPVWIQGRSHALVLSMNHQSPVCLGVWVCIKTHEVSVRLLMTAPVLQGPSGLMTSGKCDPRPWPLNLTCGASGITSREARLTAEQSRINSRMTVRVTPGEPLLGTELMTAILRLICLTAATTVHTAAAF